MHEPPVPPRLEPPRPYLPASPLERLRDRWEDPKVRIAALLFVALIAGFIWYRLGSSGRTPASAASRSTPTTRAVEALGTDAPGAGTAATTSTTGTGGRVTVHVAGAVTHPGVVRVRAGARVVDAIEAAGGGVPNADLDRLNLAAKVADGQRIAVAVVGAPAPAEVGTGGGTVASPGDPGGGPPPLVNINTATSTELEELPGIGPTLAAAIVAERERRGGFRSVGELQDVRGIGEARYADIKDLVSV
jgi:competence protein ComEA